MWTSLVSGNAAGVVGENTAWESDLWPSCREPTASPRRPIKPTQHIYNLYASVEYVLSYVALVPNFRVHHFILMLWEVNLQLLK